MTHKHGSQIRSQETGVGGGGKAASRLVGIRVLNPVCQDSLFGFLLHVGLFAPSQVFPTQ